MTVCIGFRELRPSAIPAAPGLILALSVIFLLLQPVHAFAAIADDPAEYIEIRGSGRAPEKFAPPSDPAALDTEITLTAGYTVFYEQDMYDTYGGLPLLGVEASIGTSNAVRFVVGIGYGSHSGDPFYDTPEFEGGDAVRLRVVPLTIGLRANSSQNLRFRLYWGARVEAAWMEERVPAIDEASGAPYRTDRGWGKGLALTLSPEWRSRNQRRAVGLTFMLGGCSGRVGRGYGDHEVNLMGMGMALHFTQAL